MTPQERSLLRKQLRQARRELSLREQEKASAQIYNQIAGKRFFRSAKRLAFYLPNDGEIDPGLLLADALSHGKQCYLPVINPRKIDPIRFIRFRQGDELRSNRWGILEPAFHGKGRVNAHVLDVVFVPLVGFDASGNRLGMGKGFYDRTFAFRARNNRHRPLLVGLAHECQKVDALSSQSWDVRLDKIVSDQQTYLPLL